MTHSTTPTKTPMSIPTRLKRIIMLFFTIFTLLLITLGALGCIFLKNPTLTKAPTPKNPITISPKELETYVRALTDTPKPRNAENLATLNKAADYIKARWKSLSLPVREQTFIQNQNTYRNVIASYGPKDAASIVVVGAHYDVAGDTPGADDNGSGVAGLLALSKLLTQLKPTLKHRLELVAYTLEEPPFFRTEWMGSAVHAKSLQKQKIHVKAMISLEMLGFYTDKPNSQQFPSPLLAAFYPTVGNFIAVVGDWSGKGRTLTKEFKRSMQAAAKTPVYSINAPAALPGIDFSDHLNYWKYKIPALMITDTSFFRNSNYHETTDRPETLDYKRMADVVAGIYWAVVRLAK